MAVATAEDYLICAAFLLNRAFERFEQDGRLYHPGVHTHAVAARTQLRACVDLAKPDCDQAKAV